MRFQPDFSDTVAGIMTGREKLVTVLEGTPLDQIKAKLQESRIEKMPIVDDEFRLRGLVTVRDIEKVKTYPNAAKDSNGSLLVGAAVGTGPARFVGELLEFFGETYRDAQGFDHPPVHDPCAVAFVIDPTVMQVVTVPLDVARDAFARPGQRRR